MVWFPTSKMTPELLLLFGEYLAAGSNSGPISLQNTKQLATIKYAKRVEELNAGDSQEEKTDAHGEALTSRKGKVITE